MKNEIEIKKAITEACAEPKTPQNLLEKTLKMAREFEHRREMEKAPELKKEDIPIIGSGGPMLM